MEKIKVLQVTGSLNIGGAETVAMNLYRYIDREKFVFDYLVYGNEHMDYEDEVVELGGRVIHMEEPDKNRMGFYNRIKKMLENGSYDIVHAHMMFHNAIYMEAAGRLGVRKRISHSHSTVNKADTFVKKVFQRWYQADARKKILKYSTDYFACGMDAGNFLFGKDEFGKKGVVVSNGINLEKYKYDEDERSRFRKEYNLLGKNIYGTAAHFQHVKNHSFLIDIFRSISRKDENAFLVLLGDGTLRKKIEEKVSAYRLQEKVLFMGNVNNVNEWFQVMDVYVMPSLYEGLPVALVEAQTSGLPCVVADTITREIDFTGNVKYVPLEESADIWAEICIENVGRERKDCSKAACDAGYCVSESVKKVEQVYGSRCK